MLDGQLLEGRLLGLQARCAEGEDGQDGRAEAWRQGFSLGGGFVVASGTGSVCGRAGVFKRANAAEPLKPASEKNWQPAASQPGAFIKSFDRMVCRLSSGSTTSLTMPERICTLRIIFSCLNGRPGPAAAYLAGLTGHYLNRTRSQ